jgi:hypothetical protein
VQYARIDLQAGCVYILWGGGIGDFEDFVGDRINQVLARARDAFGKTQNF